MNGVPHAIVLISFLSHLFGVSPASPPIEKAAAASVQSTATHTVPSPAIKPADAKKAKELAAKAQAMYWHIDAGGTHTTWEPFHIPGHSGEYEYFSPDLDSEEKLINYLSTVYTTEMATAFYSTLIHDGRIVFYKGKLAHSGTSGTLLVWKDAEVKLLSSTPTQQLYQFSVPAGDDEFRIKYVKLTYSSFDEDWRIDEFPEYIK